MGEAGSDMSSVVGAGVDAGKGCVDTVKGLYFLSDVGNMEEAGGCL